MSQLLTRLPNYTCLQTIERTRRIPGKRTELIDLVRLEVALVNGRELFAWPGSRNFEDGEISDMVKGGAIGNGNFALHAKSVFQTNAPRFTFAGERIREDGRKTLRWDFVVPQTLSGYTLKQGEQQAVVGYHGSFWVDRNFDGSDSPRGVCGRYSAQHQDREHGGCRRVPPSKARRRSVPAAIASRSLIMKDLGGSESQNRTTFSGMPPIHRRIDDFV